METNLKKIVWREAATGGLYLGLAWVAAIAVEYIAESGTGTGWIKFIALVALVYLFTRRVSARYTNGFSYGQSMGFIIKMMLFSGVIAGLGQYIFQNFVNPEYFQSILDTMEATMASMNIYTDDQLEMMIGSLASAYRNPLLMVLSGIFNMVVGGGIVGLVLSAFLKKPADPFASEETGNGNEAE